MRPDANVEFCETCEGTGIVLLFDWIPLYCQWCEGTGYEPPANLIDDVLSLFRGEDES